MLAKNFDFSKKDDIERYHLATKRKIDEDWYMQEEEKRADERAFFVAKNVFQRAVHDTQDMSLKQKFWNSCELIDYNEKIELSKHNSDTETADRIK